MEALLRCWPMSKTALIAFSGSYASSGRPRPEKRGYRQLGIWTLPGNSPTCQTLFTLALRHPILAQHSIHGRSTGKTPRGNHRITDRAAQSRRWYDRDDRMSVKVMDDVPT